jgi:hypothetical protein
MSFGKRNFKKEVTAAVDSFNEENNIPIRKALNEAFIKVIEKTPVDTGAAKASFFCSYFGNGGESQAEGTAQDSIRRIQERTKEFKLGVNLLLYSNLPYIELLENGSSEQAPSGMVKTTVVAWPSIVSKYL